MSATLHMEKLCNVAELNPKFKEKLKSDSSVSFVPMAAVLAEMSTVTGEEKQYCEVSKGYTSFVDGDVLVAKITPCFENGKITQAKLKNRVGFGSTEFHVVRPVEGKLDARYLLHFLRQERIRLEGERKMTGSAGQRRVPANFFASLEIPLLPLPEQKRIADILDRAEALRAKRRAILAQLDELVQSIFIDMFGDPITNPKEWEICSIGALLTDVTNGLTRRRKGSDEGTDIVLRLRDIREGWIDFSDVNRISLSYQESSRYKISVNDLLFIRVNGNPDYVGRCALFEGFSEPVYFNDHIMRVKTDQSKVDGKFLVYMLNGPRGKREIALHRKTSAGQHTINQDGLGKIEIPLPPLKIQQEFAFRTASIEKLKTVHKASLAELDDLFSSLQYRAFRGEL
ncbi:restriction endonuclease subunit S [Methanosarcina barkeri]|uniref:Type I restriction-modification system, specificity subunit S n=1 Tax=Methanosarcina barkeri 227 TaxID=1434106 RepID=A0A0E3R313_METBA|nr:restriction endonuclease subunit S [Methanosarcina barkeri]AKB57810.1 Type I restriction-modification system, specificity subunit S [Methanosarcina barkeri 227]